MLATRVHLCEIDEVFEGCVQMCLLPKRAHVAEVRVIHMTVDAKQTFKDGSHHILELCRKWVAVLLREQLCVVQLRA